MQDLEKGHGSPFELCHTLLSYKTINKIYIISYLNPEFQLTRTKGSSVMLKWVTTIFMGNTSFSGNRCDKKNTGFRDDAS